MSRDVALRVGILLPCRNEAAVIVRRLKNLALLEWPAGSSGHRVVVIDDHSEDATAELARQVAGEAIWDQVHVDVIASDGRPGKNGAIEAGLRALGEDVEFIVLTDADVLVDSKALLKLCEAFEADERLGMACGAQSFVQTLDPEGRTGAGSRGDSRSTSRAWDTWTARVRRFESRFGKLFSVHGQWLAWQRDLGLRPAPRVAADDVDLMLQARASARPRVSLVRDAHFFECKPATSSDSESQGLRRARAWFQVFRSEDPPTGLHGIDRLQWLLYSRLPARFPWIVLAFGIALVLGSGWVFGLVGACATLALLLLLGLSPLGREWRRTFSLILRARRLEQREAMPEAWEMRREP